MRRRSPSSSRKNYIRTPWFRKLKSSFHIHKRLGYVFIFLIISMCLWFCALGEYHLATTIRTYTLEVITPIIKIFKIPQEIITSGREWIYNLTYQKDQILNLEAENKALRLEILKARQIVKENDLLRAAFKIQGPNFTTVAHARVLSYPGVPYTKSIILGIGKNQGLEPLQIVIMPQGLVGRLIDVGPTSARAILITDLNAHVPVLLKPSNVQGILTGTNGPMLKLKYLQQTGKVNIGDKVETSSSEGIFPLGIEIGTVQKIEGDVITVKPNVDTDNLAFVTIIKPVTVAEIPNSET